MGRLPAFKLMLFAKYSDSKWHSIAGGVGCVFSGCDGGIGDVGVVVVGGGMVVVGMMMLMVVV